MELFKLLGTIAIDNAEANNALDETGDKGEKAHGKLTKSFNAIGKGAVVAGKAIMTGLAVGGVAVAGLATKAIQSYADFEQLVGGVETLFKDSAGKVQEYANRAYQTAGLSANEYMETVTSFSASLLQSLDGDTAKAAEYADKAIIDMSDNANKMGTSMEMIQNAYNGFAKQNYTMLDNLKLGYGGTKEEMARLLADAEKISGQKFDLSSYADVVEAIHVIQTEMGITGTTAKEASSTISGSINQMKGSWQNLLTALSSEDMDVGTYVDSFVESVGAVGKNLLPRISIVLDGIVQLIQQLAPKIITEVPKIVSQLLPSVISAATSLIDSIVSIMPDFVQAIVDSAPAFVQGFVQIFNAIVRALPQLAQILATQIPTLLPLIISSMVQMIVLLCQQIPLIIQPLIDNLPLILTTIATVLLENLPILIQGLIQLVGALALAIPQILSQLWVTIKTHTSNAVSNLFGNIKKWILTLFPQSGETILKILGTIKDYFVMWIQNLKLVFDVIVSIFTTPFKLAWEGIKLIWSVVVDYFSLIWENIKAIFSVVDSILSGNFEGAWNGIKQIWSNCVGFFKNIVSNVKNAFSNVYEILSSPFKKAKDAIKGVVDNIKGFFTGLKLEFPKIKIPKFGVKPKGWKVDDLLKGKIPKLSIEWHQKAMRNPMIMNKPTVFGYDAGSGKLLGGGEAGSEVVTGTSKLMNMIQASVAKQQDALVYYMQRLLELLAEYFPQVLEAMERDLVTNDGLIVAHYAPLFDKRLGEIKQGKDRGR